MNLQCVKLGLVWIFLFPRWESTLLLNSPWVKLKNWLILLVRFFSPYSLFFLILLKFTPHLPVIHSFFLACLLNSLFFFFNLNNWGNIFFKYWLARKFVLNITPCGQNPNKLSGQPCILGVRHLLLLIFRMYPAFSLSIPSGSFSV